jgi:methenyltetrahydromethanopterin cyclohydrolase
MQLNARAYQVFKEIVDRAPLIRALVSDSLTGGRVVDMGIKSDGGLEAGCLLARTCLSDLARVTIHPGPLHGCPTIQVCSDHPIAACLASQYAGWKISVGEYFAMGSGPMRAAAAREKLFTDIGHTEAASQVVGILETGELPTEDVFADIAEKCNVRPEDVHLLAAPTTSLAGAFQIVARSLETCLHKLHELKFTLKQIISGVGTAPLPPIDKDAIQAIGKTNDAILYGGAVTLWVSSDDDLIAQIGPQVPATSSSDYGIPFSELFQRVCGDFYQIDPMLFSPARVTFHNLASGRTHTFGHTDLSLLKKSFGL